MSAGPPTQCFVARVPLSRLFDASIDGSQVSHLLIVDRRGRIIQQQGLPTLSVDRVDGLVNADSVSRGLLAQVAGLVDAGTPKTAADAPHPVDIGNVSQVVNFAVGGEAYFAYFKPFIVPNARSQPCDAPGLDTGEKGPKSEGSAAKPKPPKQDDASSSATNGPFTSCYLVALIPRDSLPSNVVSHMPVERVELTFGLLIAALLLPALRFLMIGGAQSAGRIEVFAIAIGLPLSLVLACFSVLFALDVSAGRAAARSEIAHSATRLASQAGEDIGKRLESMAKTWLPMETSTRPDAGTCPASAPDDCKAFSTVTRLSCGPQSENDNSTGKQACAADILDDRQTQPLTTLDPTKPSKPDISGRDYFQMLRDGEGTAYPSADNPVFAYTLGVVRSQLDGFDVSVLLARQGTVLAGTLFPAQPQTDKPPTGAPPPGRRYTAGGFQIESLIDPLLPPHTRFMVVNTAGWEGDLGQLPVIFHWQRGHAGAETFREQANIDDIVAARLLALGRAGDTSAMPVDTQPFGFQAEYDGETASFEARPIAHTRWVLLIWQATSDIDAVAGQTAMLGLWAAGSLAVLFALLGIVFTIGWTSHGKRLGPIERRAIPHAPWRILWPREAGSESYAELAGWLARLAALGLLCNFALWTASDQVLGNFGLDWVFAPLAFLSVFAAAVILVVKLRGAKDDGRALTSKTEARYRQAVGAALVSVAIVPALATWADARAYAYHLHDSDRFEAARHDVARRERDLRLIATSLCTPPVVAPPAADAPPATVVAPSTAPGACALYTGALILSRSGLPEPVNKDARANAYPETPLSLLSHFVWRAQHRADDVVVTTFDGQEIDGNPWIELQGAGWGGNAHTPVQVKAIASRRFTFPDPGWEDLMLALLGAIAVIAAWWLVPQQVLAALMGFGVPLGAVEDEAFTDFDRHGKFRTGSMPKRVLVVGADSNRRKKIKDAAGPDQNLDLADALMSCEDAELSPPKVKALAAAWIASHRLNLSSVVVVWGLSLLLRDVPRRQAALVYLEAFGRSQDLGELGPIVILSDMTPLDRILDAFETDPETGKSSAAMREELRWARLFEKFRTYAFQPTKQDSAAAVRLMMSAENSVAAERIRSASNPSVLWAVLHEIRFLPLPTMQTVMDDPAPNALRGLVIRNGGANDTVNANTQANAALEPIIAWVGEGKFPTAAAVIDYFRINLIEYYEQLWFASSRAERLILDAVARGHYVNIRAALALKPLVRRGLVVLEPAPQLFSESFAMFVRQAERPETVNDWRKGQPKGQWDWARWPLLVIVPLGLFAVSYAAVVEGDNLNTVAPALLAAIPALLGLLTRRAVGAGT